MDLKSNVTELPPTLSPRTSVDDLRVCIFGGAPDTSNLGVSALGHSTMAGIFRRAPRAEVMLFDNGRGGLRTGTFKVKGKDFKHRLFGGHYSRRLHRPETYWNMAMSLKLGLWKNEGAKAITESDAVLDVSGGDSFSDLYGAKVFRANTITKRLALNREVPLILLPQTYGPFRTPDTVEEARHMVRSSEMAWARDERSFKTLCELLGADFDPERHFCGVDVAFGLEPQEPDELPETLRRWQQDKSVPLVGLNISGLIYNSSTSNRQYGLKGDYHKIVDQVLSRLLSKTDCRIVLVPHVTCAPHLVESDWAACKAATDALEKRMAERVIVLGRDYDPGQTKAIIAKTDWFCGTRMHSTIAGLSSGVPTAAMAYSLKTAGVFETCGQGDRVADLRSLSTEEMVEHVWNSWTQRDATRVSLAQALPTTLEKAEAQMDRMVAKVCELAQARRK